MRPLRLHLVLPIVVAILAGGAAAAVAQDEPAADAQAAAAGASDAVAPAAAEVPTQDWIRPEDIGERADGLSRRLSAIRPSPALYRKIQKFAQSITAREADFNEAISRAQDLAVENTTLVAIQDVRQALLIEQAPLQTLRDEVSGEVKRLSDGLATLEESLERWTLTGKRPETVAAGQVVERRILQSLAELSTVRDDVVAIRGKFLELEDRLLDRSSALTNALDRLQAVTIAEGTTILVPDREPIWSRGILEKIGGELAQAPSALTKFGASTAHYVAVDARPFFLQGILALILMALFREPLHRRRAKSTEEKPAAALPGVLEHPYAMAALLALATTPMLHPDAPQRVSQLIGILAFLPATRILLAINPQRERILFAGLFLLLIFDRLTIALSELPGLSLVSFLLEQVLGLLLAYRLRQRLREDGANPRWGALMSLAIWVLTFTIFAELGGWSSLALVLGRGVFVAGVATIYVMAITACFEALVSYALASPGLRKSRFVDRNQSMVQPWASVAIRSMGVLFWLKIVLTALGLTSIAGTVAQRVLASSISVGALSISFGGVLAFVTTLAITVLLSRLVHELLEDEIFPRTRLPRGIPHALMTLTNYAIYSLGFLLALATAGVEMSQLAILMGGLGVGIGLGLQDVVKNFAAGITLLLERRIHVGDAVQIPDQQVFGRVLSIGMRASVVRNWNGAEVVMPNDSLVAASVTNWTLTDRMHRVEVEVGVSYAADPVKVVELLLEVVAADEDLLRNPKPAAFFVGFGDNSLNFVVRAWTDDEYEVTALRRSNLALAVHAALKAAGISVPFPQRDLHLASVSPDVRSALSGAPRPA